MLTTLCVCHFLAQKTSSIDISGRDTHGYQFNTVDDMWKEQAGDPKKKSKWYNDGVTFWEGVDASVEGVLGGYGFVNDADINGSEDFLKVLLSQHFHVHNRHQPLVALDCGSGIGRVTKNVLIKYFNEVDLLEPVSRFLEVARKTLANGYQANSDLHKAVNFYSLPLQDFTPVAGRYDVIWIQWCICHLTDDDFISFFNRAKVGLKPGGLFILKENIAKTGFVLDNEDKTITRSESYFQSLFSRCGLHIYKSKVQEGFPEGLFAVKIYSKNDSQPRRDIMAKEGEGVMARQCASKTPRPILTETSSPRCMGYLTETSRPILTETPRPDMGHLTETSMSRRIRN
ncbi:unnamed protein product [Lupinus luteus]|uniref:Alpha N-terminal protein methyltransferase 1 n=1 Tax=Lupinus luteus TaxID=3873 RepID=A0AAV1Y9A1_LUPLU